MYLSKLKLNLAHSWYSGIVGNPWQTHRTVMRGFPQDYHGRVLFRLEANVDPSQEILVQSPDEPDWGWLYDHQVISEYQVKPWQPTFTVGDQCLFRVLVNPVGNHSHGPMDRQSVRRKPADGRLEDWLTRRQANLGFEVKRCQSRVTRASVRKGGNSWVILGLGYDGLLTVTDPALFIETTLRAGLGKSRGLGYGLLSVSAPLTGQLAG